MATIQDRKPNSQEIYERLRDMIMSLEVTPASRVTENQIADYFAVSRSPVRAALQKLEKEGLLSIRPKQGCFIRNINMTEISQYYDVRVSLEVMVMAEIIKHGDHDGLRKLAALWNPVLLDDGIEISPNLKKREEAFHLELARLSGNAVLASYVADVNDKIRVVRLLGWPDTKSVTDTFEEHYRICSLLLAGDLHEAQAEMTHHIRKSQEKAQHVTLQQIYNTRNVVNWPG